MIGRRNTYLGLSARLVVLSCLLAGGLTTPLFAQERSGAAIEEIIQAITDPFSKPNKLRKLEDDMRRAREEARRKAEEDRRKAEAEAAERERLRLEALKEKPPVAKLPDMSLTGIIYATQRPMAIIDGKVYVAGDEIPLGKDQGVAKLTVVTRGHVTILYAGVEHQLNLYEEAVKHDDQ